MAGLLLIGGGGHCCAVIDALGAAVETAAIIDLRGRVGERVCGVGIIGADEDLEALRAEFGRAFVAFGSVGDCGRREAVSKRLIALGYELPAIVHASAVVSRFARLSPGVFAAARAVVNPLAEVGECAIINTGAIIEHGCKIGAFAHIAPGAVLCGGVTVGRGAHVGAGAAVRQGVTIGDGALIGAGAAVVRDVPAGVTAYGNPCRIKG